jgi:hypothetical protein
MRIDLKAFRAVAQQKYNELYERKVIDVKVNGVNITRSTDFLVLYAGKASTGTNKWGTEVSVNSSGIASAPVYGKGNMAIPSGGYVLSGHGKNSDWLLNNIKKGQKVNLSVE